MKKNNFFYFLIVISILFFIPVKADQKFDLGKDLFLNKGNCAMCHMLADAESSGLIGPNLNELRPEKMIIIGAVTNACNLCVSIGKVPNSVICQSRDVLPATANPILPPLIIPREVSKLVIFPFSLKKRSPW